MLGFMARLGKLATSNLVELMSFGPRSCGGIFSYQFPFLSILHAV